LGNWTSVAPYGRKRRISDLGSSSVSRKEDDGGEDAGQKKKVVGGN